MEKAELLRTSRRTRLLTSRRFNSRSGRIKEETITAVQKVGEKYRCNICHNEVCGANIVKIDEKISVPGIGE